MIPFSSGFKQVNGITLYYEMYGEGPPLVLIHGGGGSVQHDFNQLITRLHPDFTLIGIDLQNHGKSGHRDAAETFEQDAHDVIGLLEQLGVFNATFLGFSNGGNTVLQIAHLFPQCTRAIVVASAFYKRNGMIDGFFEGMGQITIADMPQSLKTSFLELNPDESRLRNMFEKDLERMLHFQDWSDDVLSSLRVPALLIAGDQDVVKTRHTVAMAALIANSRVLILPAGHGDYLMADEAGYVDHHLIDFTASQIVKFSNSVKKN